MQLATTNIKKRQNEEEWKINFKHVLEQQLNSFKVRKEERKNVFKKLSWLIATNFGKENND